MDCQQARTHLMERRRGRLDAAAAAEVDAHLEGCDACRREDSADRELSAALEQRLPRRAAPDGLRRSLEARWEAKPVRPTRRALRTFVAMAAGATLAVLAIFAARRGAASDAMVAEAVNDHLRVVYSENPVEIESGGIHQVKPWFTGRVDFAPVVPFAGDDDFPLQGGAVGYFLDRKAATFVFKRRLHVITLFVFPADGLPWPVIPGRHGGAARATLETSRRFHVLLWRAGDLGYALVSDVDAGELETLAAREAPGAGK
jgi:anti-sigma factor RsiW